MLQFDYSFSEIENAPLIVDLALAKKNSVIEVDDVDQDDLLSQKLKGAIAAVEMYTEKVYQTKNVAIGVSGFAEKITIPVTPIKEITEVSYVNATGEKQVVPVGKYRLYSYQNGSVQRLVFLDFEFPEVDKNNEFPVIIKGAFGEASVPNDVVSAILLLFSESEMYRENRAQNLVNTAAINLLRPHRKYN